MTSGPDGGATQELKARVRAAAHSVQRSYDDHGPVVRALWVVAAFAVLAVGLAMLVLPGPAVVVIPAGIAMLAVRFRWAAWLLEQTIEHGVTLQRRMSTAPRWLRATVWLAGAATAAAVAWATWAVLR